MIAWRMRGDDLAGFVRDSWSAGKQARVAALRRTAYRARNDIRRTIRTRFSTAGRVFNAKGFAAAIVVRKVNDLWWQVVDKATYRKKRSELVGLAWVFDNAPVIAGKKGWTAVPIRGAAPIAASGRRYAWPSEAAAMGWQLQIVPIMGKPFKLIMGRRAHEPWRGLYYWIPPYRAGKRLDLDSVAAKHGAATDTLWGEEYDKLIAKSARRRAA